MLVVGVELEGGGSVSFLTEVPSHYVASKTSVSISGSLVLG